MLAPLAGLKGLPFKLDRLSDARRKQERQAVKDLLAAAAKRQQALDRLARKPGPTKPTDKLQVTTISLPGADTAVRPSKTVKPPELPKIPKPVVKTIPYQRPVKAVKIIRKGRDTTTTGTGKDSGKTGRDIGKTGRDTAVTGRDTGKTGRDTGKTGTGRDTGKTGTGRDTGTTGRDTGKTGTGRDTGKTGTGRDTGKTGPGKDTGKTGRDTGKTGTGRDPGKTGTGRDPGKTGKDSGKTGKDSGKTGKDSGKTGGRDKPGTGGKSGPTKP
jgi:hypothetical protein